MALSGLAPSQLDELIRIRRDIHAYPELAFMETRTARLIGQKLRDWGLEVIEGVGRTGVIGILRGKYTSQRSVGLRADMDALPIVEKTGLSYSSMHSGVMHACGHDGHVAMLLGAARSLAETRNFRGTVVFIFQPAEESLAGANAMLADGIFERYPCDAIYGLHNRPGLSVGHFSIRPGPVMAAGDIWTVTFHGSGGHGGTAPHLSTDVTVVAGHFLLGVHTIISRNIAARETAVISVGRVEAGSADAPNVIPAELAVSGVCRTFDDTIRQILKKRIRDLAVSLAEAHGCFAEISFVHRGFPLVNAPEQTAIASASAVSIVGEENLEGNTPPSTGSEDFAEMMRAVPGCMSFIGNGDDENWGRARLHTPHYNFNDDAIPYGISFWLGIVGRELGLGEP